MFDTRVVGKLIMSLRKEKNLTQMNLADELGVSFQAISNWERGNSMPDISKLPEIATCLGVSIDHLLGQSKETTTVKQIINEEASSIVLEDIETLKNVAPILKPQETDELLVNMYEKESVNMSDLADVAPFLSNSFLDNMVSTLDVKTELKDIQSLAPFLSTKALETLASTVSEEVGIDAIVGLAPFLSSGYLDELISNLDIEKDYEKLSHIAPFLSSKSIEAIADESIEKGGFDGISGLLPFMSSDYLDQLILERMDDPKFNIQKLYPFVSSEVTSTLVDKMMEENKFRHLNGLVPFLNSKTVEKLFDSGQVDSMSLLPFISSEKLNSKGKTLIQEGDMTSLTDIAPFLSGRVLDQLVLDNLDNDILQYDSLYPFLSNNALNKLAEKILKEKGIKGLASIAPFL